MPARRPTQAPPSHERHPLNRNYVDRLLVIGASTGGPPAVRTVLSGLHSHAGYTILIVQHISRGFTAGYARWLRDTTGYDIREATDGETLLPGIVLIAPGDAHLVVRGNRMYFDYSERRNYQRPSVDYLFESAAHRFREKCVALILTGMGRDGAEGCLAVRNAGGFVIAQDEATSAVWGMPRAAMELHASDEVLPIELIAEHAEARFFSLGIA